MPAGDLIMAGVQLMLLGMGIVFSFLALLIVTLKLMSSLAGRLPTAEDMVAARQLSTAHVPGEGAELVAVITAAISRFRTIRNN